MSMPAWKRQLMGYCPLHLFSPAASEKVTGMVFLVPPMSLNRVDETEREHVHVSTPAWKQQ